MAGAYQHKPTGMEGVAAILKDLQRQINAIVAGSPLQSATIGKGGLSVFDADLGGRMFFGEGQVAIWDDYNANPDGYGLLYCDPGSGYNVFRLFPPYVGAAATRLNNSLTLQGHKDASPGNVWIYSDGAITLTTQDENASPQGSINLNTPVLGLFNLPTTSSAANLRLATIGGNFTVGLVTSSRRYKQDIEDADVDPAAVLQLQGRTWRDKSAVKVDPDTTERHVGFIAEELDDIGLGVFVDYDDEGRPDAIQYDRLTVALVELAKSQQSQIDALTERLDKLEGATS